MGSAFAATPFLSASIFTTDTCGAIGSAVISSGDDAMTDFGRNRPTSDLVDRFIPLPIFRNMIDAEEAVEEMDRLSVELLKKRPWW